MVSHAPVPHSKGRKTLLEKGKESWEVSRKQRVSGISLAELLPGEKSLVLLGSAIAAGHESFPLWSPNSASLRFLFIIYFTPLRNEILQDPLCSLTLTVWNVGDLCLCGQYLTSVGEEEAEKFSFFLSKTQQFIGFLEDNSGRWSTCCTGSQVVISLLTLLFALFLVLSHSAFPSLVFS